MTLHDTTLSGIDRRSIRVLLLLAAISGTVTLFTFADGLPIGWGDAGLGNFLFHPSVWLHYAFYSWNPTVNLGGAFPVNPETSVYLPLAAVYTLMRRIGLSYAQIQAFYIWSTLFTAMTFSYFVLLRLMKGLPHRYKSAAIGSIGYGMSLYATTTYWRIFNPNIDLIALTPFLLLMVLRILDSRRIATRRLVAEIAIGFVGLSPAFINLAYIIPIIILMLLFSVWLVVAGPMPAITFEPQPCMATPSDHEGNTSRMPLVSKRTPRNGFRAFMRIAVVFALAVVTDALLFLPALFGSSSAYGSTGSVTPSADFLRISSQATSIWDLIRGMAIIPSSPVWLAKDPSWRYFYSSGIGVTVGVVIIVVSACGLTRSETRRLAFVGIDIFAVGILGASGTNGPMGSVFLWCFKHVPGFTLLRIPYLALAPFVLCGFALSLATGICALMLHLHSRWSSQQSAIRLRRLQYVSVLLLSLVILGYNFPLLFGDVVRGSVSFNGTELRSTLKVPPAYSDMKNLLAKVDDKGMRVLTLPLSTDGNISLKWTNGYNGPDDSALLFGVPTISYFQEGSGLLSRYLVNNNGVAGVIQSAGRLGCEYVLLQGDAISGVYGGSTGGTPIGPRADPGSVHALLTSARYALQYFGATRIATFGDLMLYRLPDPMVFPLVFAQSLSTGGLPPRLKVSSISPVEWQVQASGGRGDWRLVLNAAADPGWRVVTSDTRSSMANSIWPVVPFILSGFHEIPGVSYGQMGSGGVSAATVLPDYNGWSEPPVTSGRTMNLVVLYHPQILVGIGWTVSLVCILVFVCSYIGSGLSRRRRRHVRLVEPISLTEMIARDR